MVMSQATTVEEYLAELPEERRKVVAAVRRVVKKNLPRGYKEGMNYGMITYEIPLKRYPETYNKQPLCYAGLAAQKNHFALYLNCVYASTPKAEQLRAEFEAAGKKLDMGKSCVRFKQLDDLPLDAIGRVVASTPVDEFIAFYEASRKKTK